MALTEEGIVHVPGMLSRWVRLANGAIAHYMTSGDTGPAGVLCHGGLPGSSGMAGWRFMAPFLGENGFRVYCPDFPAYGLSDNREEHWPTKGRLSHIEFLHDFVNALCLDTFHLSGNSMGCANTLNYVITHPERVISFILIAGGVGDLDTSQRIPGALDVRKLNRETFDGTPESMRAMMEMNRPMMATHTIKDPDLAFHCGMIAHHAGAIAMAEVELKYGDDEESKAMAQQIIDAQGPEIEEMTAWVEENAGQQ